ncbi:hypothetical protein ABI59_17350 [Acidobacteria bacterium Mor1]|nr:hypothetical protein ABI59_17350 [Acidobacteria bacterium Mor1]
MRAIVSHSDAVDSTDAIETIINECRERLGGERPAAGLIYMSVDYDHSAILAAIDEAWPGLPLIGASSDGELSSEAGFKMDSVLLTLIAGEEIEACVGLGRNLSADVERACTEATSCVAGRERPALALTTFAPTTSANQVLAQLDADLDSAQCPVLGGLSGDHREFSRMMEFCGTEVLTDSLPVLYLFGDIEASWGIGSGWFPIGASHQVTRSSGHIVQEIGGRPATELYRDYYGSLPMDSLGEYPLAVYASEKVDSWTLRAILSADEQSGELRFAGDVPEGSYVRMTEVLPEGILSGTTESMRQAVERFGDGAPELALLFSCAARKWVLGTSAEREIAVARDALPAGAPDLAVAGLYVYGEIAPVQTGKPADFHNETCVTVLLGRGRGK